MSGLKASRCEFSMNEVSSLYCVVCQQNAIFGLKFAMANGELQYCHFVTGSNVSN